MKCESNTVRNVNNYKITYYNKVQNKVTNTCNTFHSFLHISHKPASKCITFTDTNEICIVNRETEFQQNIATKAQNATAKCIQKYSHKKKKTKPGDIELEMRSKKLIEAAMECRHTATNDTI